MADVFVYLILLSPFVIAGAAFIFLFYQDRLKLPKIKFEDFKRFYELNPKRWRCETDYVQCHVSGEYDDEAFNFSFIDECKYRLWRRTRDKHKVNQKHNQSTQRVLDAVKEDIAKAKAQETTDSMAEIKQLLKDIKAQGLNYEPPSLIELLKKYGVE